MNKINAVSNYSMSGISGKNVVNFRADNMTKTTNGLDVDSFEKEYEKQKKKANRDKNISLALTAFMAAVFGVIGFVTLKQSDLFAKKVQKAIAKDVSKEKTFEELALSKEMKKEVEDIKGFIENEALLKELGEEQIPGVLFYGEPGGGKNAYVYALTKYIQEKFPGSKLFETNVLKFNDKYWGGSENNVLKYMDNVIKEAKAIGISFGD